MVTKIQKLIRTILFLAILLISWPSSNNTLALDSVETIPGKDQNQSERSSDQHQKSHEKNMYINQLGMRFVLVPRGQLMMGSPSNELGRTIFEVQNEVLIEKPFYMQTTEVTQRQWKEVMGGNPSYFSNCGDNCPVENISWKDVQKFIAKLQSLDSASIYRLPTEAEWEFTCRAGSATSFSKSDWSTDPCDQNSVLHEIAWYSCNSDNKTHHVGKKSPNILGIYDMHGNVYEWCQDVYAANYAQILQGDKDDTDPIADRAVRSCSFNDTLISCRAAARINFKPDIRSRVIGFRLVREPVYFKIKMPSRSEGLKNRSEYVKRVIPISSKSTLADNSAQKGRITFLQVAAMINEKFADDMATRLRQKGYPAYKAKNKKANGEIWYLVRVGQFTTVAKAKQVQAKLIKENIDSIIIEE